MSKLRKRLNIIAMSNKSKKEYGKDIEEMENTVESQDHDKYLKIIDKYLSNIDPEGDLSIAECVEKLSDDDIKNMMDELLKLNYENDDENDD